MRLKIDRSKVFKADLVQALKKVIGSREDVEFLADILCFSGCVEVVSEPLQIALDKHRNEIISQGIEIS